MFGCHETQGSLWVETSLNRKSNVVGLFSGEAATGIARSINNSQSPLAMSNCAMGPFVARCGFIKVDANEINQVNGKAM